ncbi:sigma-54-dependent transcriptional regulator [Croceimicrobium hydrocarbonivorans]|uniref:Sigma-54-dependent Fis family transcriptional regulator n=1 Tax=Croceimicrobium hydrocarbonivorans TaxID=2761580 RepID=A0A7H0VCU9_9FLAO|nr:sigma-54 dependent transcriptional regulator [Croceimicrobium hydrocarbonivorans]QNR23547.1 sigma-54-dependent Fis family transcriptional regulator [Croceimicrobium hydrocarbonivorans]
MSLMRIFLVEDSIPYAKLLMHHLGLNPDNEVEHFSDAASFLKQLHKVPDCILLDYSLPDLSGIDVLKRIKSQHSDLPVLIVSGQEDVGTAVDLLREGAYDYIVKDVNAKDRIWKALNNIRENARLRKEIDVLREEVNLKYDFSNIIGGSPGLKKVFKLIEKAAQTNITVSITGETGTGKELVAKAIHYNSKFRRKPLVSINIAAIPSELLESELFGHEKGAFTGAVSKRIGKFEEADGGTIFLDEIGEMDVNLQAKLLRVLQEKEVTRLGSNKAVKINTRILVATHRDLKEEVRIGNFREDLYYRLLGLPIHLPPLRERGGDIMMLAKHFLQDFCRENDFGDIRISPEAQQRLLSYPWPGNVRELKAIMELAAVLCDSGVIEEKDLNFNSVTDEMDTLVSEGLSLKEYNRRLIEHYLRKNDNNVVEVAKRLDIGKSTLYRMIKNKEININ